MKETKRLKDPIYGYIEIDNNIMETIVDTAEFQRLRNIIQTSYAPLYSSAVHNRFVHSLGVYHLGSIVSRSIKECLQNRNNIDKFYRYMEIFELACLLHDLGHAPFSHTGEEYYLENGNRDTLHNVLNELIQDQELAEEIKARDYKAAPHELMSVIVSLKVFGELFGSDEEKSFFARCILGYSYYLKKDLLHSFLNCVISLLNSAVIDVDKLDYLIRDAYLTGFDTVSIDYERLLKSIHFTNDGKGYHVVYAKSAISVIENVVYAHDAERKWIQNHPVVQYETYLLKTAIEAVKDRYNDVDLFSYDALSVKGTPIFSGYRISLLSDADLYFLMKNTSNVAVEEYFQRGKRRHPLWKSESEYKAIFNKGYGEHIFDIVESNMDDICKQLNYVCKSQEMNQNALDSCRRDIDRLKEMAHMKPQIQITIKKREKCVRWIEVFKDFADSQKLAFDFLVLKASQFNSGFAKDAFGEIQIEFDMLSKPCCFKDVTNVLKAEKSVRDSFFYLYYRKNNEKTKVDVKQLAKALGQLAMEEAYE